MAYVAPNSILQLFKGINLDNRYLHTIYFANEAAQDTWFTSKVTVGLTFTNLMYRRYESNAVKVEADATALLGVTYLRFKNTRAHNKWFYAFVTGIDYVNENTTIIYYEIDVMQTWFIQSGSIRPCMVLREHVNNDSFGVNLEAEPVGSDVYDCDYIEDPNDEFDFSSYSIVAQTTGQSAQGERLTQGLFNGSQIYIYPCDTIGQCDTAYANIGNLLGSWNLQQQEEDLVSLYTVPSWLIHYNDDYSVNFQARNELGRHFSRPTAYDSYTPKNKKLFMFPYSYLLCTTHTGDVALYRWEYFDSANIEFRATGTFLGGGEIWCYPKAYNGQVDNIDSGLVMDNFPKNAYSYDAFQAWIASGGTTRLENDRRINSIKGASGVLQSIGSLFGAVTPSATTRDIAEQTQTNGQTTNRQYQSVTQRATSYGGITSAVSGIMNTGANLLEAKNKMQYTFNDASYAPDIVATKPTCNLAVASREANYYFYHCHVRDDEVKRLDDFFSCYGYSINKVKAPNLTGRQYWNFVQTQNAVIAGDMPASSKEAIGRIFDGGITFWHDGDQVGNYTQSVSQGSINNPIV